MAQSIFVNLPVESLERSVKFFSALGFTFDQRFTNENATCMIIEENIFAMLLVKPFFQSFTTHTELADAHKTTEVLLCLMQEKREAVDALMEKALANGAREPREAQELGFMYQRVFADPDGHQWEIGWMDRAGPG
jgi:predicted lactoylglutathione lyase